jgi:thymidine kinase
MSLEVVMGPMFSGKTTYAISYVQRQQSIGKQIAIIKPNIDSRYSNQSVIMTHNKQSYPCLIWDISIAMYVAQEMLTADCIVIEEAQFFKRLATVVKSLLFVHKKHILIVGLNGDASQNVFGEILQCIPFATKITSLSAFCSVCKDGTPAYYSKKTSGDMVDDQVDIGGTDKYIAVCLKHV